MDPKPIEMDVEGLRRLKAQLIASNEASHEELQLLEVRLIAMRYRERMHQETAFPPIPWSPPAMGGESRS